jgi:predicted flap endonuclease-1-like 5' DNA nuclease
MATPTAKLKGMTAEVLAACKERGIKDSDQLLEVVGTPKQRKELAQALGVEARMILELANRADLSRIKGVAGVYSDLLEAAGVDTVKELAKRRPDNLHAKIVETNEAEALTKQPPTLKAVEAWVEQAKGLDRRIEY